MIGQILFVILLVLVIGSLVAGIVTVVRDHRFEYSRRVREAKEAAFEEGFIKGTNMEKERWEQKLHSNLQAKVAQTYVTKSGQTYTQSFTTASSGFGDLPELAPDPQMVKDAIFFLEEIGETDIAKAVRGRFMR